MLGYGESGDPFRCAIQTRNAFAITDIDERLIAAAAIMGLSRVTNAE